MLMILITFLLLSTPVHAEDWAYTADKKFSYDKDSIEHAGVITRAKVGLSTGIEKAKFDCEVRGVMVISSMQTTSLGWYDAPRGTSLGELLDRVCSKWWEVWKR